jgi:hypothetical protein
VQYKCSSISENTISISHSAISVNITCHNVHCGKLKVSVQKLHNGQLTIWVQKTLWNIEGFISENAQ